MIRKLSIALLILVLAATAAVGLAWRDYQRFLTQPLAIPNDGHLLTLTPGTTFRGLVRQLQQAQLTEDDWQWRLLGRESADAARIRAGEYRLEAGLNPVDLLAQLVKGEVVQYSFTVVEGRSFQELLAELREHPQIVRTLADQSGAQVMELIGSPMRHPEGAFLPETYRFPAGTTDIEFLRRAHQALQDTLDDQWANRMAELPYGSPYEALIMASIIEKETGRADERERIAGVFVRRLQKGMRLQTDPTVIYGMGASYDGNIRRRDLRTDTPYNTYTRHGLPPTPIAMAGAAAIRAALNPADGNELYFVATGDGTGRHHFSATLAEHNRAVDRYQRGIN